MVEQFSKTSPIDFYFLFNLQTIIKHEKLRKKVSVCLDFSWWINKPPFSILPLIVPSYKFFQSQNVKTDLCISEGKFYTNLYGHRFRGLISPQQTDPPSDFTLFLCDDKVEGFLFLASNVPPVVRISFFIFFKSKQATFQKHLYTL